MARRLDELDRITADLTHPLGGIHVDAPHHSLAADPVIHAADHVHANARGHAVALAAIATSLSGHARNRTAD